MGQAVLSDRVTPYIDEGDNYFKLQKRNSPLERKGIVLIFTTLTVEIASFGGQVR
jgi:hypothetical protein